MQLERRDKELAAIGAAIELLAPRIDELLGRAGVAVEPVAVVERSRERALVAVGASVGVNAHGLIERRIAAALEFGLSASELAAAVRMAGYVQKRASEMTADKGDANARRQRRGGCEATTGTTEDLRRTP